jgi:hypothetical protein
MTQAGSVTHSCGRFADGRQGDRDAKQIEDANTVAFIASAQACMGFEPVHSRRFEVTQGFRDPSLSKVARMIVGGSDDVYSGPESCFQSVGTG